MKAEKEGYIAPLPLPDSSVRKLIELVKGLAHPHFFHGQGDFGKIIDPEGRVVEPLECSRYWKGWGTFVSMQNQGLGKGSGLFPEIA